MASLPKKGKSWYCQFYWQDRRFTFGIGRVTEPQAEAKATKAGEIVELLERGVLKLPDGVDVKTFVKHDGHPPAEAQSQKISQKAALGDLRDAYLKAHREAQEVKTLYTARIHLNHLVATLGRNFDLRTLELAHLQKHVDRRCPKVSPATAGKEIATFRTAWNWAVRMKLVSGPCPVKGLVFPKVDEKPPFQTRSEIRSPTRRPDRKATRRALGIPLPDPARNRRVPDRGAGISGPSVDLPAGGDRRPCRAAAQRAGPRQEDRCQFQRHDPDGA